MSAPDILGIFNDALVLLYGIFLSASISGGCKSRRERATVLILCPILLLPQAACWLALGMEPAKRLYPLIVHLPLFLSLVLALKRPVGIALVSVCTAYLFCQLPRFGSILAAAVTGSELAGEIVYTALTVAVYLLLQRFFVTAALGAMSDSRQSLLLFGALPVFYYMFDYATTVYSNLLYEGSRTMVEAIPSVLIIFYVAFLAAYRHQLQLRSQTRFLSSMLAGRLRQMESELASLRTVDSRSALYRHDMRHHMSAIDGLLAAGKLRQAREYIKQVQSGIEAITPKRYCKNELVNLILSSFDERARRLEVRLTADAALPEDLGLPDTELSALLSNGMENALLAAGELEPGRRWVSCYCALRNRKLLIEIKNPYDGVIVTRGGLPVSDREGHGYGCRSINSIVEKNGGLCVFEPENGIFTLRIALPAGEGAI